MATYNAQQQANLAKQQAQLAAQQQQKKAQQQPLVPNILNNAAQAASNAVNSVKKVVQQGFVEPVQKMVQPKTTAPTAPSNINPNTGKPMNAQQQANLKFQQDQLSGKISSAEAQKIAQQKTADALQNSKTIDRYAPTDPKQIQAQQEINARLGIDADVGLKNVPRNQATGATQANPLITRGQMPGDLPKTTPQTPDQMLETIAMKQYKKEPLTDDEVKFQIKQQLGKYKAPQSPAQNFQQQKGDLAGSYYRAPMQPGQPLKVPLPPQYPDEATFAASDPQGYDKWATANGYGYSNDDVNYSMNAPGNGLPFTVDDYINATPEKQQQMQQMAFNANMQQQMGLQNSMYEKFGGIFDDRIKKAEDAVTEAQKTEDEKNAELLQKFKDQQAPEVAQAIAAVQKAGEARKGEIKEMQSFSGFGRSSKTVEILDNAGAETQQRVADIEREAQRNLDTYQISLLDKTQQRIDKLQARVDATMDKKDELELTKAKDQMGLVTDLMKQNPMSPQNMIATAEKLQKARLDEQKLAREEQKDLEKSARENFQFMVSNYGSQYFRDMDQESLSNLASNLGMSPQALQAMPKTLKEIDSEYEKMKYVNDFNYRQQNDMETRQFQLLMSDRNFQNELQKMGIQQDWDVNKMYLDQQFKDAASQKKYANLGYGNYAAQATTFTPQLPSIQTPLNQLQTNPNSLAFGGTIQHPFAKGSNDVVAMNPKLVNAYTPGYKKQPGPSGLGGQCAFEARQIANIEPLGNTPATKLAKLKQYIAKGQGFMKGQGTPQPGDVLVSNASKQYGHAAVVNAVCSNGDVILSEFNYAKPLTFSNTRRISATSPEVVGFIRAGLKDQYKVQPGDIKEFAGQASQGFLKDNPILAALGKIAGGNPIVGAIGNALADKAASAMNNAPNYAAAQDISGVKNFQSPEELATFVAQNGVDNLQQYDWWNNSPFKKDAWAMLQQAGAQGGPPQQQQQGGGGFMGLGNLFNSMAGGGQQQQQTPGFPGQQQNPQFPGMQGGNVDEQGMQLTPDRQMLRSGQMADFQVNDIYKQLTEGYQATGDPNLKAALNQFIQDYQVGASAKQNTGFNQQLELTKQKAQIENQYKPVTETQGAAATYATRLKQSEDIFDQTSQYMQSLSAQDLAFQRNLPSWAGKDDRMKAQEQAERNFINAVLRRESGAAIADSEFASAAQQYFPQPGDTAAVLAQKKQNRGLALQGMLFSAGPQGQQYYSMMYPGGGGGMPGMPTAKASSGGVGFNVQGAVQAGYSPQEILQLIASQGSFDVQAAKQAGYSDEEILQLISSQ